MSQSQTQQPAELTISALGPDAEQQPSGFRLVFTLGLAGMLSGFMLSFAYQITKPIIDENNRKALQRAVLEVVPDSTTMHKYILKENGSLEWVPIDENVTLPVVYGAYNNDEKFLGYAIPGSGSGFQDTISLLYGYNPVTEHIIGLEILESKETPGLGDRILKDPDFDANFNNLAVKPEILVTKNGAASDNEVDAITGATISSKAVVSILNATNLIWLEKLPDEPPAPPAETIKNNSTPQNSEYDRKNNNNTTTNTNNGEGG